MDDVGAALDSQVSRAAFRRLFTTGAAKTLSGLASDLERPEQEIGAAVEELKGEGRIRVDDPGRVVGAAGLSVVPDRHRIELAWRTFWTWCAYDILGIFGALRADGMARSASPHSSQSLEVHFHQGRPEPTSLVIFRPDDGFMSCCANVYEDWCRPARRQGNLGRRTGCRGHRRPRIGGLPGTNWRAAATQPPATTPLSTTAGRIRCGLYLE